MVSPRREARVAGWGRVERSCVCLGGGGGVCVLGWGALEEGGELCVCVVVVCVWGGGGIWVLDGKTGNPSPLPS
jgi:hypothetical protein